MRVFDLGLVCLRGVPVLHRSAAFFPIGNPALAECRYTEGLGHGLSPIYGGGPEQRSGPEVRFRPVVRVPRTPEDLFQFNVFERVIVASDVFD